MIYFDFVLIIKNNFVKKYFVIKSLIILFKQNKMLTIKFKKHLYEIFFFYFDHTKSLYLNIDISKKWKFDVIIYHDRCNIKYSIDEYPKKANIQFILFFSRLLSDFEKRYWFTELKMTELI